MSDRVQNDWDVVEQTLQGYSAHPALEALSRLREFTAVSIAGLQAQVTQLEEQIRTENRWPGERKHGTWEYQDRA